MGYMKFAVEGLIPYIREISGMKSLKTMESYFYKNMFGKVENCGLSVDEKKVQFIRMLGDPANNLELILRIKMVEMYEILEYDYDRFMEVYTLGLDEVRKIVNEECESEGKREILREKFKLTDEYLEMIEGGNTPQRMLFYSGENEVLLYNIFIFSVINDYI